MAKKIKGEDGKIYKVKKPFYKRLWFIILAFIVVVGIIGSIGGGDSDGSSGSSTSEKLSTSKNMSIMKRKTMQPTMKMLQLNKLYRILKPCICPDRGS